MKQKTGYLVADSLAVVLHPVHVRQHISDPRLVSGNAEVNAPSGHQTARTIESYRLESDNKEFVCLPDHPCALRFTPGTYIMASRGQPRLLNCWR